MQPLPILVSDLLLPQTEHDEDDEALQGVEDEEENAEGDACASDGEEPEDPRQAEKSRHGGGILHTTPSLALIGGIRLVRRDRLATREAPHHQEEDDEVNGEEDGDQEHDPVVESWPWLHETTGEEHEIIWKCVIF